MAQKPLEIFEPGEAVTVDGRPGEIAPAEVERSLAGEPVDMADGTRRIVEPRHITRERAPAEEAPARARALTQSPRVQHKAVLGPREER